MAFAAGRRSSRQSNINQYGSWSTRWPGFSWSGAGCRRPGPGPGWTRCGARRRFSSGISPLGTPLHTVIETETRARNRRPWNLGRDDGVGGCGAAPDGVDNLQASATAPNSAPAERSPSRATQRSRPAAVPDPVAGCRSRTMVMQEPAATRVDPTKTTHAEELQGASKLDGDRHGGTASTSTASGQPDGQGFHGPGPALPRRSRGGCVWGAKPGCRHPGPGPGAGPGAGSPTGSLRSAHPCTRPFKQRPVQEPKTMEPRSR